MVVLFKGGQWKCVVCRNGRILSVDYLGDAWTLSSGPPDGERTIERGELVVRGDVVCEEVLREWGSRPCSQPTETTTMTCVSSPRSVVSPTCLRFKNKRLNAF